MKAAVCYEFGQPLTVEEIDIDPPKSGEVRVRMVATAICHSDLHVLRGDWGGATPVVAGHEGAGIVDAVGSGVDRVSIDDHVVVSLLRSCGRCEFCSTGAPHLCSGTFLLKNESRLRNRKGQSISHGLNTAAFAEYVIVDQSQLAIVPNAMSLESACLLACGVITGVGAVVNKAQVRPGSCVVVIGTGGVGLNSIQGARLAGARQIIAVDILDSKLEASRAFGATHTVNATMVDVKSAIAGITDGQLADYVFVTVGSQAAAEQGFTLIRKRGMLMLVGAPNWVATINLPIGEIIVQEKTITGSLMGSTRLSVDVARLVSLYEGGKLMLDELITARYPIEKINDALSATESGSALRNIIVFG